MVLSERTLEQHGQGRLGTALRLRFREGGIEMKKGQVRMHVNVTLTKNQQRILINQLTSYHHAVHNAIPPNTNHHHSIPLMPIHHLASSPRWSPKYNSDDIFEDPDGPRDLNEVLFHCLLKCY
jgi:hypothetical protein